jgi:hypothetical protein
MLLICFFGALLLMGLPSFDAPETAFDGMDAPITLLYSGLPLVRLTAPTADAGAVPDVRSCVQLTQSRKRARGFEPVTAARSSHDLQPLLCTFLI